MFEDCQIRSEGSNPSLSATPIRRVIPCSFGAKNIDQHAAFQAMCLHATCCRMPEVETTAWTTS